jgi:hypothetical protein
MASSSKRLSSSEYAVLERLFYRGGKWNTGDRPLWESQYWTLRLLNILASQGLVEEEEKDTKYSLSSKGLACFR